MDAPRDRVRLRSLMGIQARLILLLFIMFASTLLIQAYVFHQRYQGHRSEQFQANLEIARAAAGMFKEFLDNVLRQELAIGIGFTLHQPLPVEQMNAVFAMNCREYPAVRNFAWATPEGRSIASNLPGAIGQDITGRPYYREIIAGKDHAISDLYVSQIDGAICFSISRGIRDATGSLLGIVIAIVVPDQLDQVMAVERARGGSVALVDGKGMLVYRHPTIDVRWEERGWINQYPQFEDALKGKEVATTVHALQEGKRHLAAFAPVAFIGWAASAGRTEEEAMAAITASLFPQAILFLLATTVVFALTLVMSRKISTPVARLRNQALALGRGETVSPVDVSGPTELKDLAEAFNAMANELRRHEARLREQREWLRVTLGSVGDAVIATDLTGRITFINPIAAELTGWQRDEAESEKILEVFRTMDEETRKPAGDLVERVLDEGKVALPSDLTALISREGREVPVEGSASPIKEEAGNILGVVLVFRDVTDRKRMEEQLRRAHGELEARVEERTAELVKLNEALKAEILQRKRSEEALKRERQRFHDVLDMLPAYVILLDTDHHVPFLNRFFRERFGESGGRRCYEWLFSCAEPCENCETFTVLKTNTQHHWEWIGPDGRIYDIFDFPFTDSDGSPLIMEVGIDITELRRAEQSLKEANESLERRVSERTDELAAARDEALSEKNRLEAIMEALPVGLAILDERGGNIRSNEILEKLWGLSRPFAGEVRDYDSVTAWWIDTGQLVRPEEWASARAISKGETVLGQLMEIDSFDGGRKFIMNSAAPVHDARGRIVGCVVAIQDITGMKRAEREVQHRAAELEAMFVAQGDVVLTYDARMDVKRANPAFSSTYGFDPVGLNLKEIVRRVSCRRLDGGPFLLEEQPTPRALHGESVSGACFVVTRADGADTVVQTSSGPMRLGEQITGSVTVWHDITELKRVERELRENKEHFRILSETAGRLLVSDDPRGIVNELCSEVMEHLDCQAFFNFVAHEESGRLRLNAFAGIPEEEARSIEWLDYGVGVCGCVARDGVRIVAEDIRSIADPRTELVQSYGIQAYACHPLMAGGRVIGTLSFGTKTRTRFSPQDLDLMKTVADQVAVAMERIRLIGELEDARDKLEARVGERTAELEATAADLKASEGRLRKSNVLLQKVFDGISDPLIMLDDKGLVSMINKAATDYYCVCEGMDFLGKPCYQGLRGREIACAECDVPFLASGPGTMTHERKGFRNPGRVENVTVYPIHDVYGRRDAVLVKITDITKAKILERQILQNEKLASLGLVTSGIAHEINNPNSFIYFNLPILRRYLEELMPILDEHAALHPEFEVLHMSYGELKEDIFKLLGNMEHGTRRISKTVEVLKSFVRKRGTEGMQQVDLKQVLDKVVALCHTELRHKVGSFEFLVPEDLPPLFSDPEALEQVFLNLLINAIHACDKPDSRVSLKVERGLPDGNEFLVEISDNGSGIEETVRERMFDPFFTTKSPNEGTGLGLYICHSHVESLGGRIEVESSPGRGSTFRVLLPQASGKQV